MEDEMYDGLYDSLPEMHSLPEMNSLPERIFTISYFMNELNPISSSLNTKIPIKNGESDENKNQSSLIRCSWPDNVQWAWENFDDSKFVEIVNDNMDVIFHKKYSIGTGIVRCTEPMSRNQYYWEILMTHAVYGTDVMVGIGTSDAEVKGVENFVSLLGRDDKTWGLSYTGLFHHNGNRKCYTTRFVKGNVIGVHLDLWRGTLSFYRNRKHLGVACSGLKDEPFYAMASSTAACSGMRIVHSCSFSSSLQFLCCAKLRELIPDDKNVLDVLDIPPGLRQVLQSKLSWLLSKRCLDELDFCALDQDKSDFGDNASELRGGHVLLGDLSSASGRVTLMESVPLRNCNRFHQRPQRPIWNSPGKVD